MASSPPPSGAPPASWKPEIGPDGIARESPIIAYTEKVILAEQLQLKRYIQENYSKIREVERELEGLTFELKLTAGPKKAALEHMRKKIELSTERIRVAKLKEEQAKKAWEVAAQAVKDEEAVKQKLCDDLNQLVQESTSSQYIRLEELKRRLEALNPGRTSSDVSDVKLMQQVSSNAIAAPTAQNQQAADGRIPDVTVAATNTNEPTADARNQRPAEVKEKKRTSNSTKAKGSMILPKGRGAGSGWTGAGFDVDNGT
ncbi:hypothetical protein Cni_G25540 [Canna indica]|uniref:RAB6-interacting golgin n=1 Tax=Canna indica TaxID=4628 RepID=A0AAQ3KX70_9LILI|nr:hypothetical protein Cni_G25540 [Canna indica]